MLGQSRRRWPNIKVQLVQRLVFAGICIGVVKRTKGISVMIYLSGQMEKVY